ncbi:MAG: hypothetical protein R6U13_10365, partial [Desulfatiglandaceae bacterium]
MEKFTFYKKLKERFVFRKPEGYQILSFFPDENSYIESVTEITKKYPEAFVASQNVLSRQLSRTLFSEIFYLSGIA